MRKNLNSSCYMNKLDNLASLSREIQNNNNNNNKYREKFKFMVTWSRIYVFNPSLINIRVNDKRVVTRITGENFVQRFFTINGWLHGFLGAHASQVLVFYCSSLSVFILHGMP